MKWGKSHGEVMGWLRAPSSFAVIRATNLCLRGSCIKWRRALDIADGCIYENNLLVSCLTFPSLLLKNLICSLIKEIKTRYTRQYTNGINAHTELLLLLSLKMFYPMFYTYTRARPKMALAIDLTRDIFTWLYISNRRLCP